MPTPCSRFSAASRIEDGTVSGTSAAVWAASRAPNVPPEDARVAVGGCRRGPRSHPAGGRRSRINLVPPSEPVDVEHGHGTRGENRSPTWGGSLAHAMREVSRERGLVEESCRQTAVCVFVPRSSKASAVTAIHSGRTCSARFVGSASANGRADMRETPSDASLAVKAVDEDPDPGDADECVEDGEFDHAEGTTTRPDTPWVRTGRPRSIRSAARRRDARPPVPSRGAGVAGRPRPSARRRTADRP